MGYLSSGNRIVDAMGSLNITGNVIPTIWYKTILRENRKPYLLAIAILADIVYWYRPVEVRNQATGQILGWKKKFSGDILRQSYQYYADLFGESKKTVKTAIDRLENLRVLKREFRTVSHGEGLVSNNVMYLKLVPEQLYRLTYPEAEPGSGWEEKPCPAGTDDWMGGSLPTESGAAVVREEGSLPTNSDTGAEEMGGSLPTNSDTPMEKLGGRGVQNGIQVPPVFGGGGAENFQSLCTKTEGVHSQNVGTYTEITSENTYGDYNTSIIPSIRDGGITDVTDGMDEADAYMALVRQNIEYEHHMKFDRLDEKELYEELYAVICEVVCVKHKSVRIGGAEYPYGLVKERFLKLKEEHLRYVIGCMRNTATKITNIKAYMITALYNAPMTMNHYYQHEANFDMRGGGWQTAEAEREERLQ